VYCPVRGLRTGAGVFFYSSFLPVFILVRALFDESWRHLLRDPCLFHSHDVVTTPSWFFKSANRIPFPLLFFNLCLKDRPPPPRRYGAFDPLFGQLKRQQSLDGLVHLPDVVGPTHVFRGPAFCHLEIISSSGNQVEPSRISLCGPALAFPSPERF